MKKSLMMFTILVGLGCGDPPQSKVNDTNEKTADASRQNDLRVAHLTDPHLFDGKSKNITPERIDEGCLNMRLVDKTIAEVNKLNAEEPIDVVVVTGDLGVEKLIEDAGIDCKKAKITLDNGGRILFDGVSKDIEINEKLEQRSHEFAAAIAQSKVHQWLFVNGNNDLCNEDVKTLRYFSTYLANVSNALAKLNAKVTLHNLVVDSDHVTTFSPATAPHHVFIGFENGSFKNNHSALYANDLNKAFQENLLVALEEEIKTQEQSQKKIHLVFHAPHFDDPFNAGTAKNACEKRLPTNATFNEDCSAITPKISTNAAQNLYSAWLVPDNFRKKWDTLTARESVKNLFAGHFHSQTREDYLNPKSYQTQSYANLEKYNVAPPISIKNQTVAENINQARGFSLVTLKRDGSRDVQYYWSNQTNNSRCNDVQFSEWKEQAGAI